MDTSSIIIKTDRLILKSITYDFKEDMFKEFTPEVTKYMFPKSPEKIEETIEFIECVMDGNKKGTDFVVMIIHKDSGAYLGNAGIHKINTSTPELGVWIKKSAHGNAFGKEAIINLKDWADKNLNYEYLLYPVDGRNIASKKIPESLGGSVFSEYRENNMSGEKLNMLEFRIYK